MARYSQGLNIDEPLAMLRGGATSFYHADGLGSVTSLSSSAGSIANTYTYDSFGNLTASTGSLVNPFRYTAREFDTETSLYYYRARYYDQASGRFATEDTIRFEGKDINLYRFVRNRPSNFSDPLGRVVVDPSFNPSCLPDVERALDIVRKIARRNRDRNCAFKKLASHRSLSDLVDDPNITIHSAANDVYQRRDDGLYVQGGFTDPYDTHNIYIRPFACRMGRWDVAAVIVHELTHVGTGSLPGDDLERAAQKNGKGMWASLKE